MEILLVEDHAPTALGITNCLRAKYHVTHVLNCLDAERKLQRHHFDAVILDLNLPDHSGITLCDFGNELAGPKVLVLSGQHEVQTKVAALNSGADDYVTKPFSPQELHARLQALLRRGQKLTPTPQVTLGNLCFCSHNATITRGNITASLTPQEQRILTLLLQHHDQVIPKRTMLVDHLGIPCRATLNTLEAHIRTLRRKLGSTSKEKLIQTIYGVGYRLNSAYA